MSKSFFTIGSFRLKLIRSGYCINSCSYKSIMWFACLLVIPWHPHSIIKFIMTVCAVPYTYNGILQRVIIVVSYVSIIWDRFRKLKSVTSEECEVMIKRSPRYFILGAVWKCNISRISAKYCNSNTPRVIMHILLTHMQFSLQNLTSMLANKMNYGKFVQSLSNFEI